MGEKTECRPSRGGEAAARDNEVSSHLDVEAEASCFIGEMVSMEDRRDVSRWELRKSKLATAHDSGLEGLALICECKKLKASNECFSFSEQQENPNQRADGTNTE